MPKNENVTTKFKVDISDLKKNITDANKQIKLARAEFKNATAGANDWAKSADGLTAKIKAQTKVVDAEKTKLDALKQQLERLRQSQEKGEKTIADLTKKYEEAAKAYGETSDEAKAYAKELDKAKAAQDRNTKAAEDLNVQIIEQDTAVKKAESELGKYQTALGKVDGSSMTLTEKIKAQETELKELKTQYANVAGEQGKTSDEAKALADKIKTLSGDLKNNKDKLNDAKDAANDLDKSFDNTAKKGVSTFQIALGNLVANALTAAVSKLADLGKYAADAFKEVDEGEDAVIKATGAVGADAESLKKSYKNVAKTFKGDFSTIGKVLGEVNTRFGYTDKQLEEATKQFLRFADITGTDATTAVQDVSKALKAAGMEDKEYSTLLDQMAAAAQSSGISISTLTAGLTKNGSTFRAMGLDTESTIAILAQFEAAGVNTETVLAGMKTATKKWADEGKNANDEFANAITTIATAKTPIERTQAAMEIFGKKAGTEVADAIGSARFNYADFIEALEKSQGTVKDTYEQTQDAFDDIDIAVQNVKTSFAEFVGDILTDYGPELKQGMQILGEGIQHVFGFIAELGVTLGEIFGEIYLQIEKLIGWVGKLWDKFKQFLGWLSSAWKPIDLVNNESMKAQYEAKTGKKLSQSEWRQIIEDEGLTSGGGRFAKGGIVTSATRAIIGEDGAEAVIPLEKNKSGLKQIAALLRDEMNGGSIVGGTGGRTVNYTFNQTNNSPTALSRWDIYRQTQNLINAAKGV